MKPIDKKQTAIGIQIRILRQWKGFSQENMADMLGISLVTYGDIERGKTDISLTRLLTISQHLNVSAIDILMLSETAPIPLLHEAPPFCSVQPDKSV